MAYFGFIAFGKSGGRWIGIVVMVQVLFVASQDVLWRYSESI